MTRQNDAPLAVRAERLTMRAFAAPVTRFFGRSTNRPGVSRYSLAQLAGRRSWGAWGGCACSESNLSRTALVSQDARARPVAQWAAVEAKIRPRCCAKTRAGAPCVMRVVPGKRRCRFHGGLYRGRQGADCRDVRRGEPLRAADGTSDPQTGAVPLANRAATHVLAAREAGRFSWPLSAKRAW
jgi:hypothetical protein